MLLILQLLLRAIAVEVDVSLGRTAKCTASCVCSDASRVVACREIDMRQMAMKLDLAEETPAQHICTECFFRVKTAADIERIVQSLPDIATVGVEIGDQEASLYKSMAKGIVGLKADRYYLVTAEDQKGLLARYGFVHLAQHSDGLRLGDEKTAAPPDLQNAIILYFNAINGVYMINEMADGFTPLGLISEPEDYSTTLYWAFICTTTTNLLFGAFKIMKLARAMFKRSRCVSL